MDCTVQYYRMPLNSYRFTIAVWLELPRFNENSKVGRFLYLLFVFLYLALQELWLAICKEANLPPELLLCTHKKLVQRNLPKTR